MKLQVTARRDSSASKAAQENRPALSAGSLSVRD